MRDIVVLIFLIVCLFAAMRVPWHGVLALAIFSYLNPHSYAWGFAQTLPAFMILFCIVALRTVFTKDKQSLPKDWRIPLFICLYIYFIFTTTQATVPYLAWPKLIDTAKIYIPYMFTVILINTKEKLYYLIITIAASIGVIASKGGIFAALHGFSYRVYGPRGTQFYDNNQFALAVLINIPLLILWYTQTSNKKIKMGLMAAIPLSFITSLSSWSRGALLAMAVLLLILLWNSKRKFLVFPLMLVGAVAATKMLPEEWFGRMNTIETHKTDASAMGRIRTWTDGWNFTLDHPLTGSGFEGWHWVTEREWHSAYVEMFAEHGFIAFAMWLSLIIGTLFSLTKLAKQMKGIKGMEWVENYCFLLRASLITYMVGGLFLGLSYWDLLYHLIFIAVLIKKFALEEMAEKLGNKHNTGYLNSTDRLNNKIRQNN
ncbi:MAG: putative O-glycosylation ligase, exosortase A system-associated [Methyloprofundus sp.]|nr:putative O-glycosylation ligase, exosortase A system-associated [Methyloprofundus sp.]